MDNIDTIDKAHAALDSVFKDYPDADPDEIGADAVNVVVSQMTDPFLIKDFCEQTVGWVTSEANRRINELTKPR
jgi:hypothetical protein